jgi:hypothetical protein
MLLGNRMLTFIDRRICDIKQVLEPHDWGKKPYINQRLFNVNSKISKLKIMILFSFYLFFHLKI